MYKKWAIIDPVRDEDSVFKGIVTAPQTIRHNYENLFVIMDMKELNPPAGQAGKGLYVSSNSPFSNTYKEVKDFDLIY